MNSRALLRTAGFILIASQLRAAPVSFPAGGFEGGTASNWAPQSTGAASASTPSEGGNTFGRIDVTLTGDGSLTTSVPSPFEANSLYVISLDLRSASVTSIASRAFGVEVLDANGTVIAELDQEQLVGVLGVNLGVVSELTGDLSGLAGKLDLVGVLQPLLALLDGNPALLGAVEQLVDSLAGADPSVVSEVVALLEGVLNGTIDPGALDPTAIGSILGLIDTDPVVTALDEFLNFAAGDEGPVEGVVNLLEVLLATPGDFGVVQELLATLVGGDGLVQEVADLLLYALSNEGLLGSLTDTLTRSLLGVADPNETGFQNVKMIFSVGSTVPEGAIGIRLLASASAAVGLQVDYDNVAVERFALVSPPGGPGIFARPSVVIRGKKVRKVKGNKMVIRGRAIANGDTNRIAKVEYRVKGSGVKNKKFRKARGLEKWRVVVRPNEGRTRVIVRATDAIQQKSPKKRVALVK